MEIRGPGAIRLLDLGPLDLTPAPGLIVQTKDSTMKRTPIRDSQKDIIQGTTMDRLLVLVRHGQSEWNLKNLFTGWKDVGLTPLALRQARTAGRRLRERGIHFDVAFTSILSRAEETCRLTLEELGQANLETIHDQALNERDYGDLTGLNKDDARVRWGAEQVHIWRRSYDVQPPGGESLKDTVARVLPYYIQKILPRVMRGERVLVAAHGNSLRALVMVLDHLTPETIPQVELGTGVPLFYRLNTDTTVARKEVLEGEAGRTPLAIPRGVSDAAVLKR